MSVSRKPIIDVRDVDFTYGTHSILHGVSVAVREGQYVAVLGPNGGGKTTLIRLITGRLLPSRGSIFIDGHEPRVAVRKGLIGYVPQRASQRAVEYPATVQEIVTSGRYTAGRRFVRMLTHEDRDAVERALEVADVHALRDRRLSELSGGQRQRVFIARALASEAKLLVLDEPTVGIDAPSQEAFYTFLNRLNREEGMTIVFVSHDIDAVSQNVSHVICLNHQLVCHNTAKTFFGSDRAETFLGTGAHSHHTHRH